MVLMSWWWLILGDELRRDECVYVVLLDECECGNDEREVLVLRVGEDVRVDDRESEDENEDEDVDERVKDLKKEIDELLNVDEVELLKYVDADKE